MSSEQSDKQDAAEPIAIVGLSAIMPGAPDVDTFWRLVIDGRDTMTDVPAGRWSTADFYDPDPAAPDKAYARRGAFLPAVEFDPMAFGISPRALPSTDAAQLLALVATDRLLAALDHDRAAFVGDDVGVFVGSSTLQLLGDMALRIHRPAFRRGLIEHGLSPREADTITERVVEQGAPPWQESTFPGLLSNVVAGRIANRFDLHGANFTVDAACASSLAAISVACDHLRLRRADMVITGGVDTLNDAMTFVCFSKTPALSPTGQCRPFDEHADGTLLGEGLALFALKRLADAESAGDRVHAVIRGLGSSSDGGRASVYSPVVEGQARALRRAYAEAGYDPGTVELVEAHGTGTVAGDATEIAALTSVFADAGRSGQPWCAIGSVKSQIGHTKAAAGAAGLLKATLALSHGVLPPTINVARPNPALRETPFYINLTARPWLRRSEHPRRAAVSSFGFGGSNFHVTLEEYQPPPDAHGRRPTGRGTTGARPADHVPARPTELVPLSADSPADLIGRCHRLLDGGDGLHGRGLAEVARTAQQQFRAADSARLSIVASDCDHLRASLCHAVDLITARPEQPHSVPTGVYYRYGRGPSGRTAFLFPGQGAQYLQMGSDLAVHFPEAADTWSRLTGPRLRAAVFPHPQLGRDVSEQQRRELADTRHAQPALAVHSLALLAVLDAVGVRPDAAAGHSFGELIALHTAGAWDEDSLARLARRRGDLICNAIDEPGTMLALEASVDETTAVLDHAGIDRVWVANHNAPRRTTVAATTAAMTALERATTAAGITTRRLDTAAGFHSPLVAQASTPLRAFLAELAVRSPRLDVYSNARAARYPLGADRVRDMVADHVAAPVRFAEMIQAMHGDGIETFVEVGPGAALTSLIGQILEEQPHHAIATDRPGRHAVTSLHHALGQLAVLGVTLSFEGLWRHHPPPADPASRRPPAMPIMIDGGFLGRRFGPAVADTADEEPTEAPPPPPVAAPSAAGDPAPDRTSRTGAAWGSPRSSAPGDATQPLERNPDAHPTVIALLEVQRETVRAHSTYLTVTEKFVEAIAALTSPAASSTDPAVRPSLAEPTGSAATGSEATTGAPATTATHPSITPPATTPAPVAPARRAGPTPAPPAPTPSAEVVPAAIGDVGRLESEDFEMLVLSAVSKKTGYPTEILAPHMELEADLGLDSITRTQVLAALRPLFPQLAGVDRSVLAPLLTLRTVGEIAAGLQELMTKELAALPPSIRGSQAMLDPRVVRRGLGLVTAPAPGHPMPGLGQGLILVVPSEAPVADAVARTLSERGIPATAVSMGESGDPLSELSGNSEIAGVVHVGGLQTIRDISEAFAIQREAFRCARRLAGCLRERGGVFVAVQDTAGGLGVHATDRTRSWLGGLAALPRVVGWEWPNVSVKTIDCQQAERGVEEVAEVVVAELLGGGLTRDVALRADGSRWLLDVTDMPEAGSGPRRDLGEQPVIVVTGGARGVTAAATLAYAKLRRARFVLIGRTRADEAGPELTATLDELVRSGSQARYLAVDIRDERAVSAGLEEVRVDWGPVTGIVHGAGVIADGPIADKTDDEFDRVFDTKLGGLRALLAATRADPLRLLCVFSSIVATSGNPGQSDYVMANETLRHVVAAEAAARTDFDGHTISWGPWGGAGMVTPELEDLFRLQGVSVMPVQEGAQAFADDLASARADPHVIIGTADAVSWLQESIRGPR